MSFQSYKRSFGDGAILIPYDLEYLKEKQWARVFPIFHRKLNVQNKAENVKGLFTVHFMLHLSK